MAMCIETVIDHECGIVTGIKAQAVRLGILSQNGHEIKVIIV